MTNRGVYEVCVRVAVHKTVTVHADGFDEAEYMASEKIKQEKDVDASTNPEVLWVTPVVKEEEM